jgi:hypothetical protein
VERWILKYLISQKADLCIPKIRLDLNIDIDAAAFIIVLSPIYRPCGTKLSTEQFLDVWTTLHEVSVMAPQE